MAEPVEVVTGIAVRQGRVLLVRNQRRGVLPPGGKPEPGETHEQTLARELLEETGLSLLRFGRHLCTDRQPEYVCHVYAMEVSEGEPRAGDDALAAWWGTLGELQTAAVARNYPLALEVVTKGVGPRVVTLCGSTRRAKRAFREWEARLELEGYLVYSTALWSEHRYVAPTQAQKDRMDAVHRAKIDRSDELLVLDVGGYIGPSTQAEIEHAKARGVRVRYLSELAPGWSDEDCLYVEAARSAREAMAAAALQRPTKDALDRPPTAPEILAHNRQHVGPQLPPWLHCSPTGKLTILRPWAWEDSPDVYVEVPVRNMMTTMLLEHVDGLKGGTWRPLTRDGGQAALPEEG